MLAAVAVAIAAGVPSAWGSIYTGANNGLWSVGGNWSAGVPGPADTAEFADNVTPATRTVLDLNTTIGQLSFTGAFNQIGANPGVSAFTLTINNGLSNSANSNNTFTQIKTIKLGGNQDWYFLGAVNTGDITAATNGMVIQGAASDQATLDLNGFTLTKTGAGRVSFGSMNVTAGNINITSGQVRFSGGVNQPIAISGAGTITVASGASLQLGANGGNVTIVDKTIAMNGGTLQYGSSTTSASGSQAIAAAFTFSGNSTFDSLNAQNSGSGSSWTFSNNWSGGGSITFVTNSATANLNTARPSYTILSGDNSGLTGVIDNQQSIAIASGTNVRGVNFGSNTAGSASAEWGLNHANAVYRLNGFNVNLGALSGNAGTLMNGHASTASTATLGGKDIDTSFDGAIANGAAASLSIVKTGTGVQTLTGNNSYTGSTTINDGTLQLTGAGQLSGTSGITINGANAQFLTFSSNAVTAPITLTSGLVGGTGAINTPVTIGAGGTVSPGASPGTQPYGSGMTWANSGTYLWEINQVDTANVLQDLLKGTNPGHDWLDITGTLAVTADTFNPFVIEISSVGSGVTNWDNTKSYTWTIATASTAVTGFDANVFSLDASEFIANNPIHPMGAFSISADANSVYLNYAVIPEPSSLALLLFGAIGYLAMFRRRNG
jgi:autotransporter-associated beta strand protein